MINLLEFNYQKRSSPTPELTRRQTQTTTRIEPFDVDERQAEGGRVE
jgi:hypothetical protein